MVLDHALEPRIATWVNGKERVQRGQRGGLSRTVIMKVVVRIRCLVGERRLSLVTTNEPRVHVGWLAGLFSNG